MNCNRTIFLTILFLPLISQAYGAEDVESSSGAASWHWTPEEWTYSETGHDTKGFAERPDEATLAAIVVEWQAPELDALGNFCTLRGRLSIPIRGQAKNRTVDWLQGVTVYMAQTSGGKPDWSKGMDQADTEHSTAVARRSGDFRIRIDLRKAHQDRGLAQKYQFGIALASHIDSTGTRQKIVWNSRTPAIPATISMISVPAAPKLSHAIDLMNNASGWPFQNPDGTSLIRATNALQRLGKVEALAELEKYLKLTSDFSYHSEQEIVFWIIRVLFPPEPGVRLPPPAIAVFLDDREVAEADKWPVNPLAVINDVPFMVGHRIGMGGRPEHPSSFIEWAKDHGKIRETPVAPTTDPLTAAEALFADEKFRALDEFSRQKATRQIRSQALAMAGMPVQEGWPRLIPFDDELDEKNWKAAVSQPVEKKVSWDEKREQFVSPE